MPTLVQREPWPTGEVWRHVLHAIHAREDRDGPRSPATRQHARAAAAVVCRALRGDHIDDDDVIDVSWTVQCVVTRLPWRVRWRADCGCTSQVESCCRAPCGEYECTHSCGWCSEGDHARCDSDHVPCDDCETCGCDGDCAERSSSSSYDWPWQRRDWSWRDVLAPAGTPTHPRAAGIELEIAAVTDWPSYLETTCRRWDITVKEDGSVDGGAELATRPARGDETAAMIRDLCGALRRAGARVDDRCGLHVHVAARPLCDYDARGEPQPYAQLRRRALLCAWWAVGADVYETIAGRDPNDYCREIGCPWDLGRYDYESPAYRYHGQSQIAESSLVYDRYHACNLHALRAHRTVEWRLFAAHTDADLMIRQVSIVQRLTHWAATAPPHALRAACEAGPLADRGLTWAALPGTVPALLAWCEASAGVPDVSTYESEAA